MKLNKLTLKDKRLFERYLSLKPHNLAVYAWENIYIWRGLFDIRWQIIEEALCIFFQDNIGCFLYLAPLAQKLNPAVIDKVFKILNAGNKNQEVSRIENVEEPEIEAYHRLGYDVEEKPGDYLCLKAQLADLKGNHLKHKRASANYFVKNYSFQYLPFSKKYLFECLALYHLWASERKDKYADKIYRGMIKDSLTALEILLNNYQKFNCIGRIVKVGQRIKAFSFGFKLNAETFCILYEISDLSVRGLAQFIFREFCRELKDYKYINIMDDSGLENLKKVKLSYKPVKLIPSYIVKRKVS